MSSILLLCLKIPMRAYKEVYCMKLGYLTEFERHFYLLCLSLQYETSMNWCI